MPTVIYIGEGKVRIRIYPKDHFPPHVHAIGPDSCEAKFEIQTLLCTYSRGFSLSDLKRIQKYLEDKQELLMEAWNEYQKD